ncbi:MAG: MATE family efflux transporter [Planctomycetaceae bacterium]|nr:MATE family efflux transporter [Planctomycetaceae bacterium]
MVSDRSAQLGQGSVFRLLVRFSGPAIVGMMAQAFYNLIDRVFVGHAIGADGIAGIAVAFPFMLIMLAFGMLIGFGGAALISIRLGEQRKADAERILGNAAVLLTLAATAITAVGLAMTDRILGFFGASETVLPYAHDYLQIITLGTVFQMVGFGLNAVIRGEGNPRIAMLSMFVSVVVNFLLAPVFIFWLRWGMMGAALATVLAQAATAVWVLLYFVGGTSVLRFRARNLRLDPQICRGIMAIGSPPCLMQLAASFLWSILNNQLHYHGGDTAVAAMGVIYAVIMTLAMPIFGLNQGAQPIIGYNYGARRFDRVKKTLETAVLVATAWMICGFVLTMLFPSQIIRLFCQEKKATAAMIALGGHAIQICTLMLPIIGFQIVSASYFQSVGKPREAMLLLLSRQLFILVPAVLILPHYFGLDGVWAALPTSDLASSLLTAFCLFVELRRLRASSALEQAA